MKTTTQELAAVPSTALLGYRIVEASSSERLQVLVRQNIEAGFEPYGSVAVAWAPGLFQTWAQAMIYKPNPAMTLCGNNQKG